jgi:hypothetical protein
MLWQLALFTRAAVGAIATTDITNKEEVSDEKIPTGGSVTVRYICVGR